MAYVILYLVVVLLGILFLIKKSEIFTKGIFFILILFSGFRYNVGKDFKNYEQIYNNIKMNNMIEIKKYVEFGYIYLNKIIIYFRGNFQLVLLIMALLSNIFIYKFIKKSFSNSPQKEKYMIYSIYIFFLIGAYYISSFNAVRQFLTISIFLYSYKFIEKRELKKYIIYLTIGSFFHKSLILLIPLYWILNIKKISLKYFFIFIFIDILFVTNLDIIIHYIPFYKGYSEKIYKFSTSYILLLGLLLLNLFIIFFHKNIKLNKYEYNITLICILLLFTIVLNKNIYPSLNLILMRLTSYFYFFNIVTIPKLLWYLKKIIRINIPILFFIIMTILYFKTTFKGLENYLYNLKIFF